MITSTHKRIDLNVLFKTNITAPGIFIRWGMRKSTVPSMTSTFSLFGWQRTLRDKIRNDRGFEIYLRLVEEMKDRLQAVLEECRHRTSLGRWSGR